MNTMEYKSSHLIIFFGCTVLSCPRTNCCSESLAVESSEEFSKIWVKTSVESTTGDVIRTLHHIAPITVTMVSGRISCGNEVIILRWIQFRSHHVYALTSRYVISDAIVFDSAIVL